MFLLPIGLKVRSENGKAAVTKLISIVLMGYIIYIKYEEFKSAAVKKYGWEYKMGQCDLNIPNLENTHEAMETYFAFISMATGYFALKLRQRLKRRLKGEPTQTPSVIFNNISRLDADKSFVKLSKFLVNYGKI